ncbi:MAG: heparinase II/III family protein [Hyphomicrobiaceae bacterium]
MNTLTTNERYQLARLLLKRTRGRVVSDILNSPVLRWQFGAPVADELLLVPQELRTSDASFAYEIEHGMFGLGGSVASLGEHSVFDIHPPSPDWNRELHGFSWLRHLSSANSSDSRAFAVKTVDTWITKHRRRIGTPWQPDVVGRRVFSWLANTELLLDNVDPKFYDRFTDSLGSQLVLLSARWRDGTDGLPRLVALTGLLTGALCIAGHDSLAARAEVDLSSELERQVHEDGGHISRDPRAVLHLLLDLLPLETCFKARQRPLPKAIMDAIPRMLRFLQYMRLGDGSLAHFNGMGATPYEALATLGAYLPEHKKGLHSAETSGYPRLNRGDAIVIVDAGPPPDLEYAARACAGCLSFEFSAGASPIFVNGGAPGPANNDWLAQSRSSASHNTVVLGARSSSRPIRHPTLERLIGGIPVRQPENVPFSVLGDHDAETIDCQHDGYKKELGLIHRRRLRLAKTGEWLEGIDDIIAVRQVARPSDTHFSVHFHLHPDVRYSQETDPESVEIKLPDGSTWAFAAGDETISIEESIHYADQVGPTRSWQIVVRGTCFGDKTIHWRIARLAQS